MSTPRCLTWDRFSSLTPTPALKAESRSAFEALPLAMEHWIRTHWFPWGWLDLNEDFLRPLTRRVHHIADGMLRKSANGSSSRLRKVGEFFQPRPSGHAFQPRLPTTSSDLLFRAEIRLSWTKCALTLFHEHSLMWNVMPLRLNQAEDPVRRKRFPPTRGKVASLLTSASSKLTCCLTCSKVRLADWLWCFSIALLLGVGGKTPKKLRKLPEKSRKKPRNSVTIVLPRASPEHFCVFHSFFFFSVFFFFVLSLTGGELNFFEFSKNPRFGQKSPLPPLSPHSPWPRLPRWPGRN